MKTQQSESWTVTETECASVFQITGSKQNGTCDDRVIFQESNTAFYYGVADGMSRKRFSGLGAELSLRITQQYIENQGISKIIEHRFHDELPGEMVKCLRHSLLIEMERLSCELDDLASTLLLIAIDKLTKQYIIVHIGDGAILGIMKGDDLQFLSEPDNPMGSKFTWMTTRRNLIYHTRFLFGSTDNINRIVLVSDGADMVCFRKTFSLRAGRILKQGKRRDIQEYLFHYHPVDDATCIVVDFPLRKQDKS